MLGRGRACRNSLSELTQPLQEAAESIRPYLPTDISDKALAFAVRRGCTLVPHDNGYRWMCLYQGCGRSYPIDHSLVTTPGQYDTTDADKHWRNCHKKEGEFCKQKEWQGAWERHHETQPRRRAQCTQPSSVDDDEELALDYHMNDFHEVNVPEAFEDCTECSRKSQSLVCAPRKRPTEEEIVLRLPSKAAKQIYSNPESPPSTKEPIVPNIEEAKAAVHAAIRNLDLVHRARGGDLEEEEPELADVLEELGFQMGGEDQNAHQQEEEEGIPQENPAVDEELVHRQNAAHGTIRWLKDNANEPVVPGGKPVMVVIFTMLAILSHKNIHKETFDLIMEAISDILPAGNHWPRSFHLCSGAAGVENPQQYEEHICSGCCQLFPHLPREQWSAHSQDFCQICGEDRFTIKAGAPHPRKRMWDLRIERVIMARFSDPKFRAAHGKGRDYDDPTNLYAGPGFAELDNICNGRIGRNRPEGVAMTSLWALGQDGLNLTTFTKKKTSVAGVRCEELPPHMSHTHAAFEPLIIIEDDVQDPSPCFKRTVDVLLKHSPLAVDGCPPPVPLEVYKDLENAEQSIRCYIMLSMFQGDYVQQGATAKVTGHTGEKGCLRCYLMGTNTLDCGTALGTQRWLGCHHSAEAEVLQMPAVAGEDAEIVGIPDLNFVVDTPDGIRFDRDLAATIEIQHEHHGVRVRTAAAAVRNAALAFPLPQALPAEYTQQQRDEYKIGCPYAALNRTWQERQKLQVEAFRAIGSEGSTEFDRLPYYRWHLFWAFHVAHALIYGVVAVFWKFLLRQPKDAASGGAAASHIILSSTTRNEMSRRVQSSVLRSTGCVSGKIPDVTKVVNCMTLSDWTLFVRALSPYVLHNNEVPQDVMKLWAPLRRAAMYFLDYREGQHHLQFINDAQDSLAEYARLAERMVPKLILNTIQLHNCLFHLPKSVERWGPGIFRTEFWVERMMQLMKRITKYRTMCSPELVACAAWLLKRCIAAGAAVDPALLEVWQQVDPMSARLWQLDEFDWEGNALTKKVVVEDGAVSDQRESLSDALREVDTQQPGSKLARLYQLLERKRQGNWVADMRTASAATLHMGTTKLCTKHERVGAVEDCYAFIPFDGGLEGEHELAVMEVHGIASISWHAEEEELDVDDNPAEPDGAAILSAKVAWGQVWTCSIVNTGCGSNKYCSFVPADMYNPNACPQPHCLPSLLKAQADPYFYAVELKDIHASCLNGRIRVQGMDDGHEQVFIPYRPVGSHG